MPELADISETSGKSFRLRFSLLGMLVTIAILAAIFGYLGYYRPAKATVAYQVATFNTKQFDALGLKFNTIEDSPYRWVAVKDFDLSIFTPVDDRIQKPFKVQKANVLMWPKDSANYVDSRFVDIPPRNGRPLQGIEITHLQGSWGVRKAGLNLQFRIDLKVAHQYPDFSNAPKEYLPQLKTVEGKIFFEGNLPTGDLLFVAPIDKDVYHAVLVRVRPMDDATNATTKTTP